MPTLPGKLQQLLGARTACLQLFCGFCLQAADAVPPSTVVVKIVKISPAAAPCRSPESQHTVSILDSTQEANISFSAVYQPCNLLERPKVRSQCCLFCMHPTCGTQIMKNEVTEAQEDHQSMSSPNFHSEVQSCKSDANESP